MCDFKNRIAVVTGAGSGIGRALALALARQGATVCLIGRRREKLLATAAQADGKGAPPRPYPLDLTIDEEIQALGRALDAEFGAVDLLIHCAGVFSMGRIDTAAVDALDAQYRTNVRAPYVLSQALLPMLRQRQGQVVFINSTAGQQSKQNLAQYGATKHALRAIADSLRAEVNGDGVRVLSVYPGRTRSPMQAHVHELEGKEYDPAALLPAEDIATMVVAALGLSRGAEVTELTIRPMQKSN